MSWITESGEARYGLWVDRSLVPNHITDVPVHVMNVLYHPVTSEKREVVNVLNLLTVTESGKQAPNMSSTKIY